LVGFVFVSGSLLHGGSLGHNGSREREKRKGVSVHIRFGSLDLVSDLVSNMGFLDLVFISFWTFGLALWLVLLMR